MILTDERMLSMVRDIIEESLPTPEQRASGAQALRDAVRSGEGQYTVISVKKVKPKPGSIFLQTQSKSRLKTETDRSTMQQAAYHKQNDQDEEDTPYSNR